MKSFIYFLLFGVQLVCSCRQGIWVGENLYRPRHARFQILKLPFIKNSLIDTNYFYISKQYHDGVAYVGCYGFLPNGQMLNSGGKEFEINSILPSTNSISTAPRIGYYTTKDNKIMFEYFIPGDGGQYEKQVGLVTRDTILIIETTHSLFRNIERSDTLIKSSYPLKY